MDILSDQIKGLTLSKTEKKVADYLIANQDSIGFSTALDLAREIGTSDTSLIRFVHRMGYPSFSAFKREMGSQLVNNSRAMRSSNKYAKSQAAVDGNVIGEVYERAMDNIRRTCTGLDQQRIREVADILINSRVKYICAFRTAQACAAYMSGKLSYYLPNVLNIGGVENHAVESLIDITPQDCLLMYSFPMYSEVNFLPAGDRAGAQRQKHPYHRPGDGAAGLQGQRGPARLHRRPWRHQLLYCSHVPF